MRKIVAIGGGEIKDLETIILDREIVKLTGKKHPRALFIPTASGDAAGYVETFHKVYGKKLGCRTDALLLTKEKYSRNELRKKILSSDLIYVGGGNTLKMLRRWRQTGVDKIIKEAWDKGIVLSGLSAGAICWFRYGFSDSRKMSNPNAPYIAVHCLDYVNATVCPHFRSKKGLNKLRFRDFPKFIKARGGLGFAIDEHCALEIIGGNYRVVSARKNSHAYKIYNSRGKPIIEMLQSGKYIPLSELLSR
jgi:dipeptidase E